MDTSDGAVARAVQGGRVVTWKDCKQTVASSAKYRCDTCSHFKEPMDSYNCKDCELNKNKPMLLKRFGERESE